MAIDQRHREVLEGMGEHVVRHAMPHGLPTEMHGSAARWLAELDEAKGRADAAFRAEQARTSRISKTASVIAALASILGVIIGVVALIIAVLAWRYP